VKVVLDSNVILAAFATRGLCEAVLAVSLDRHEIVLSEAILSEVARHLQGKFKLPVARVREIVTFLRSQATFVTPEEVPARACRDKEDRVILGTAVAGDANCLVTGDKDLLALGCYHKVPILSPRAFYDLVK